MPAPTRNCSGTSPTGAGAIRRWWRSIPDGVLLDITGCAHLFGGETALIENLVARVTGFGFACRVGLADTIGAAWAVARFAQAHVSFASPHAPFIPAEAGIQGHHLKSGNYGSGSSLSRGRPEIACGFIPPGGERAALAPLPLKALRIAEETAAGLRRLGFGRIGDIMGVARAPLAARFGAELLRQLDRALGREREPLTPLKPVAPYVAEQVFAEPILREEDVLAVAERLAQRLSGMLERRGEGMRDITLELFRTDGKVCRIAAGTSRPLRDAGAVRALLSERLAALADPLDPGFGFDLARLNVTAAEPSPPQQTTLDETLDDGDVDHLVDRLSARLGRRRVNRLVAQDSHIPELAAAIVPAQAAVAEHSWQAFRQFRAAAGLTPRPLRLLTRPEPIDAVASVPDGPPLRFRWRRALHEVAAAEGPERIEGAWWSEQAGPARDYFRVEDAAGRRFWIFRAGLYRDTAAPSWFLHGMFA